MNQESGMRDTGGQSSAMYAFRVAFVAAVGGFLFGYDLVIVTGALLYLQEHFNLGNGLLLGFTTMSAGLGCIFGPFLGMFLCDSIGRRNTMVIAAVLFGVSAILTAMPVGIYTFIAFRFVGGMGVGLASIASPMYIAEMAPARMRGRLGLMYQMAIVIGAMLATVAAYIIAIMTKSHFLLEITGNADLSSFEALSEEVKLQVDTQINRYAWRWMFGCELAPIVVFVFLLMKVPRSPRWLAEKGRHEEALAVLTRIDGSEYAQSEMAEIQAQLSEETGSWSELLMPGVKTALLIGIGLAFFNNFTGWTGIAYFMTLIFEKAGAAGKEGAIWNALIVSIANMSLTLIAIYLVDKAGRRPVWIFTSAAMIISMGITGAVFHIDMTGPIILLVIVLCLAPHSIGLGPLPWLMMSEIQPTRIRAKAVAITTTVLWIAGFVGPLLLPVFIQISEKYLGSIGGVFWFYGVVCIFSLWFGIKCVPETKGKTLEQIAEGWLHKKKE